MAIINLGQQSSRISMGVGEARVADPDAQTNRAITGLGEKASSIVSEMMQKQRENDIKQSAWKAQSEMKSELTSLVLNTKTDGSGFVLETDEFGRTGSNYKLGEDGTPEYYSKHVANKISEMQSRYKESFGTDEDKFLYFDSLTRGMVDDAIIKSILKQNDDVEKYTIKNVSDGYDQQISAHLKYAQPDAVKRLQRDMEGVDEKNSDLLWNVNPSESLKLKKEKWNYAGKIAADKILTDTDLDPAGSNEMLTDFVGLHIAYDPKVAKFLVGFLKESGYDDSVVKEILNDFSENSKKYARMMSGSTENIIDLTKGDDELLKMEDIDLEASLDNSSLDPAVKQKILESSKLFSSLKPDEQQNFIEAIVKKKYKDSKENKSAIKLQMEDIIGKAGEKEGIKNLSQLKDSFKMLYATKAYHDIYQPVHTVNQAYRMVESIMNNQIASNIPHMGKGMASLKYMVKRASSQAKALALEVSGNSKEVSDYLSRIESGGKVSGPMEQRLMEKSTALVAEYRENPAKYIAKYGHETIAKLESDALLKGDVKAQQKLESYMGSVYRSIGIVGYEQDGHILPSTVNTFTSSVVDSVDNGNISGAASSLLSVLKGSQSYSVPLLNKASEKGLSSETIGAAIADSLGGVGTVEGTSKNIMRVTGKKSKDVLAAFSDIEEKATLSKKSTSQEIAAEVNTRMLETLPTMYKFGEGSNTAKFRKHLNDYITFEVKARISENPELKKDVASVVKSVVNEKIGDKVTDIGEQGFFQKDKVIFGILPKSVKTPTEINKKAVEQIESFKDRASKGEVEIDYDKMPPAFKQYLGALSKKSDKEKVDELSKRFDIILHSTSLTGETDEVELSLRDNQGRITPIFIKQGKNKDTSFPERIKGISK